ncbi:sensor histidine kinase [Nesterenkonia sp. LB17]|uniref:sensor histidine kinase n=1 Tax=unclassified Nesterenkonia TaxID=2629769 RepID=UPI001F4CDD35|nr:MULTISPECIES: sensor histidine kinase [unclassified Nesterenkonia]MCH8561976.1 sensor histidine kinase [Nesterenkonia sp. YGD6]MCH8564487.1 sensor histidine kinase [Nesterenkonia sp. LB17]
MAVFQDPLVGHRHLSQDDVEWLHALVGDWQLISDLAFSDVVLWFPHTEEGFLSAAERSFIALAQARPSTTQTLIHRDVVGDRIRADLKPMVERAWTSQVETNSSDQGQPSPARMRVQAIPLLHRGRTVGVITLHFAVAAMRSPSRLELTYRRCAEDLLVMAAEGRWPDASQEFTGYGGAPRVGDGLLRLDAEGRITFASPNAVSALLRLGVSDTLEGRSLAGIGSELQRATGVVVDESQPMMLTGRRAMRAELEAHGAAVTLRSIPLYRASRPAPGSGATSAASSGNGAREVRGGEHFAALVLCRDVTELRRRDKQLMSKDATIKEIHHRVKNNLQTVSALLRMQSRRMDSQEGREGLRRAMRRVETIAMVHDSLSKGLEETVDVDELMRRQLHLAAEMAQSDRQVITALEGSFGQLPPDMVTPLALVITEIVANAVEHGFGPDPAHRELHVSMSVQRHADAAGRQRLELELTDDGVGLPEQEWEPGLGLQIVRTLVRGELSGSIEWETASDASDGGTAVGSEPQAGTETARTGTRVKLRAPILAASLKSGG